MDDNIQDTDQPLQSLPDLESGRHSKILPLASYQPSSGPVLDDMSMLQRDLGKPQLTPNSLRIGRLRLLLCPGGWLKVEVLIPDHDSEAELLGPEDAEVLKEWVKRN